MIKKRGNWNGSLSDLNRQFNEFCEDEDKFDAEVNELIEWAEEFGLTDIDEVTSNGTRIRMKKIYDSVCDSNNLESNANWCFIKY